MTRNIQLTARLANTGILVHSAHKPAALMRLPSATAPFCLFHLSANATDIVAIGLIVVAHVAMVEVHVPRVVRDTRVGSGRPIVRGISPRRIRSHCWIMVRPVN